MPANYKEIAFEAAIEAYLLDPGRGYEKGDNRPCSPERGFDRELAMFPLVVTRFIRENQPLA